MLNQAVCIPEKIYHPQNQGNRRYQLTPTLKVRFIKRLGFLP